MISDRHLLSAAHCFDTNPPLDHDALIGHLRIHEKSDDDNEKNFITMRKLVKFAIHKEYNPSLNIPDYDISVLTTDKPVTISSFFQPICFPTEQVKPGTVCTVAGWGKDADDDAPFPEKLRYVTTPVIPNDKCLTAGYDSLSYYNYQAPVRNRQTCAGSLTQGGFGFCHGDSGGGLFCPQESEKFQLHGIVSWSIGCAAEEKPDVYTRVNQFIPFIRETTKLYIPTDIDTSLPTVDTTACGGVFNESTISYGVSVIGSPNWPEKFSTNLDCVWTFIAPKLKIVKIDFYYFSLHENPKKSRMVIQEKGLMNQIITHLGTFSGSSMSKSFYSSKRQMIMKFKTSGAKNWPDSAGFLFEYSFIDNSMLTESRETENCNFMVKKPHGSISFDMKPEYILPCRFRIEPINFTKFKKIEFQLNEFKFASVYETLEVSTNSETHVLSGVDLLPDTNLTSTEPMDLVFRSKLGFDSKAHFKFSYSTVLKVNPKNSTKSDKFLMNTKKELDSSNFKIPIEYSCPNTVFFNESNNLSLEIRTPSYPFPYPRGTTCFWKLRTSEERTWLRLHFNTFMMEHSPKCQYDGVKIFTKKNIEAHKLDYINPNSWNGAVAFCGMVTPPDIVSSGQALAIGFYSDDMDSFDGFSITATVIKWHEAIQFESTKNELKTIDLKDVIFECDFNKNTCGMTLDESSELVWERLNDYTPSQATGPPYDRSYIGHYLYTEATNIKAGTTARALTPKLVVEDALRGKDHCVSFYYDMYGQNQGQLRVIIKEQKNEEMIVWQRTGQQRNKDDLPWQDQAHFQFTPWNDFQIVFESERGIEYTSDTAIDDILITSTSCPSCASKEGFKACGNSTRFCYKQELQCNGIKDCEFEQDESDCGQMTVFSEGVCFGLSQSQICDGNVDCQGGYDEIDCEFTVFDEQCGVFNVADDLWGVTNEASDNWSNIGKVKINGQYKCPAAIIKTDDKNIWFLASLDCLTDIASYFIERDFVQEYTHTGCLLEHSEKREETKLDVVIEAGGQKYVELKNMAVNKEHKLAILMFDSNKSSTKVCLDQQSVFQFDKIASEYSLHGCKLVSFGKYGLKSRRIPVSTKVKILPDRTTENHAWAGFVADHERIDPHDFVFCKGMNGQKSANLLVGITYKSQFLKHVIGVSPVTWLPDLHNWIDRPCPGQFSCDGGKTCINENLLCDSIKHCADGSDEDNETCKDFK